MERDPEAGPVSDGWTISGGMKTYGLEPQMSNDGRQEGVVKDGGNTLQDPRWKEVDPTHCYRNVTGIK